MSCENTPSHAQARHPIKSSKNRHLCRHPVLSRMENKQIWHAAMRQKAEGNQRHAASQMQKGGGYNNFLNGILQTINTTLQPQGECSVSYPKEGHPMALRQGTTWGIRPLQRHTLLRCDPKSLRPWTRQRCDTIWCQLRGHWISFGTNAKRRGTTDSIRIHISDSTTTKLQCLRKRNARCGVLSWAIPPMDMEQES